MSATDDQPIINKVASSGLVLLELETLLPEFEITSLDIAPQLWQGMVLKEKDFRAWVKEHDWSTYAGKHVAVYCSADAIIQHPYGLPCGRWAMDAPRLSARTPCR